MEYDVLTIGHSTRPIGEFLSILSENGVDLLADVRTVPKSAYNPQYWGTTLRKSLKVAGIDYRHFPDLGGLRKPKPGSVHTGWRNRSFHGYADHMESPEFLASLDEVIRLSRAGTRIALMCAEAVPWRCHRNLIADALVVRGLEVGHIMGPGKVSKHTVTKWATVIGKRIIYGPEPHPTLPFQELSGGRERPRA
jgi:uncharacterized protein (DUF488 family)